MKECPARPTLREIFLSGDRRLEVYFYTSNLPKFLHAATVFRRSGLSLRHFKSKTEPYSEDYASGTEGLLTKAISEIIASIGRQAVFFVEDTSLRIDALSRPDQDYPGLAAKEWFAQTSFERLDNDLIARGGNRRAIVNSDIGLHLPGLARPLLFHGETAGVVASTRPGFQEDSQHPWLTPTTFNGWFIPDGSDRRLGEMDLEDSWKFDFRTKALEALLSRLEEYATVLNIPVQAYARNHHVAVSNQLLLFQERPVLVVVGKTCAGKSSFGEYAESRGFAWAEASAVLRTFRSKFVDAPAGDAAFAKLILRTKGQDVVAQKVLELYANGLDEGLVVTGFRTIEELETIKRRIPRAQVVLVEASERLRFDRHLARGRLESLKSIASFHQHDAEQWKFGLLRVSEDFADIRVTNEGSLEDYHKQVESVLEMRLNQVTGISRNLHPRHGLAENQLFRCLQVLHDAGRSLSCEEIQTFTSEGNGCLIRHNNANKVLKRVPELAVRHEEPRERLRYEITDAGRAYLRYMMAWSQRVGTGASAAPTTAAQSSR